jgi:uncharacterized protein
VHGISFEALSDFDWTKAFVEEDDRRDYGELRFRVLAPIGGRVHMLIFTPREGRIHVISLRKANKREVRIHAAQTEPKIHA